ncbi:hypothetical protein [Mariprofundus ferrooxydans]|uniref:hypothetical protein n=1 Tax=Mariprofundus ferrooxydans TaxID=314344 RepID=UPI00143049C6|nr:hypothetical protein [Mariprofundus ferrooxydans]
MIVMIWRASLMLFVLVSPVSAWALDSYRFLHVTIDTPWFIFIFLFFLVFAPMILSAILHWRNALRRDPEDEDKES